jgi:hypothetical protein
MVFEKSYIQDDELAKMLCENRAKCLTKNPNVRTVFISDADADSDAGNLWDIPDDPAKRAVFPNEVVGLSSAFNDKMVTQATADAGDQTQFTYYLVQICSQNREISSNGLLVAIRPALAKYNQELLLDYTNPNGLLDQTIFPAVPS